MTDQTSEAPGMVTLAEMKEFAGFTALMESAEPAVVLPVFNQYLDRMCTFVGDKGGTIDKIVGDVLHVYFDAPLEIPDHAERAVDHLRDESDPDEQRQRLIVQSGKIHIRSPVAR